MQHVKLCAHISNAKDVYAALERDYARFPHSLLVQLSIWRHTWTRSVVGAGPRFGVACDARSNSCARAERVR